MKYTLLNMMIYLFTIILGAGIIGCQKKSEEKILGTWKAINRNDLQFKFSEKAQGMMIQKDGKVMLFTYSIESVKIPNQIDINFLSKQVSRDPMLGIFEFSGDSLVIVLNNKRPLYIDPKMSIVMIPSIDVKTEKWETYIEENTYELTPADVNRNSVTADLTNIAALSWQYFRKPPSLGGGGNSFIGFWIPNNLLETANGHYELNILNDNEIELTGIGNQIGKDGSMVRVSMIVGGDKIISTTNNN